MVIPTESCVKLMVVMTIVNAKQSIAEHLTISVVSQSRDARAPRSVGDVVIIICLNTLEQHVLNKKTGSSGI